MNCLLAVKLKVEFSIALVNLVMFNSDTGFVWNSSYIVEVKKSIRREMDDKSGLKISLTNTVGNNIFCCITVSKFSEILY